jgi:hypothetical protein
VSNRLIDRERFTEGITQCEVFIGLLGLDTYDLSHGFNDA